MKFVFGEGFARATQPMTYDQVVTVLNQFRSAGIDVQRIELTEAEARSLPSDLLRLLTERNIEGFPQTFMGVPVQVNDALPRNTMIVNGQMFEFKGD